MSRIQRMARGATFRAGMALVALGALWFASQPWMLRGDDGPTRKPSARKSSNEAPSRAATSDASRSGAASGAGASSGLTSARRPVDSPTDDDERPKSLVGRVVDDFALKDIRGAEHRLSTLKNMNGAAPKAVVVVFLGTECPLAKLYAPRLAEMQRDYGKRGVAFVAVNANRQDSLSEIVAWARTHGVEFPVLKDLSNRVADAMGAERTPEAFLLDAGRVVRYHGRIDDQYGVGTVRKEPTRRDLAVALDQLLDGKPIELAETKPVGCFIGRVRQPAASKSDGPEAVTWSNQISRLFQTHCVQCHRPGEIAPFSLTDYSEVAGWADTILEAAEERRMPPWHADPAHGEFANERRLSRDELALLKTWVAAGAPEGNPAELPKPLQFTAGWQLDREPDAVVTMRDQPFDVPAEGAVDYKYFTVDPGFTEDKWIQLAEAQPGNRAVVHHILVMVRPPDGASPGAGGGEFLVGYVPGMRPRPYPKGMAKLIPKGSKLVFQMHYTPNGSKQTDLSRLGLRFADPDSITHVVVTSRAANARFAIPPGDDNYRIDATSPVHNGNLLLLGMMPHMHLRGKSFRYDALFPDGRAETLLNVPRYDFNWQTGYALAEPIELPAGTRIRCEARFDNSKDNPSNPDPTQTVRWGDQTWNEMMIGYFDVAAPLGDAVPKAGPRPGMAVAAIRRRQAEEVLRRFDADKDGKVQKAEVPERLHATFDALDINKDGVVTLEEIEKAGEKLFRR